MTGNISRTAKRAVGAVGAVALAIGLAPIMPVMTATASASAAGATTAASKGTYLALGDSVAFGYVPSNATPPPNYADPSSFIAYPEDLARAMDLSVANASCPGETTASMIAVGAQSNGCENSVGSPYGYRTLFPLHVNYSGTQMAYALHYLGTHPNTQLVTIDIGANDAFVCQETTADGCTSSAELKAVARQIRQNLRTIYTEIRDAAGYHGPLVALTYYSPDYASALDDALIQGLNADIAGVTKQFGGLVANGFRAFKEASKRFGGDPCAAGLLIKVPGGCNIHPSPAGHLLLAATISQALGD